jgi:hypothetical protein
MGYPTKVQLIRRQASEQWYINFPAALAQAMEFTRGETVEWIIEDRSQLLLRRLQPPPSPSSKKKRPDSSTTSASSGKTARGSAASGASSSGRKPSP